MLWDRTNRPLWLRCTVGVLAAVLAAAIRWQFLGVLELRATFLTFYPAVAVAALYGGMGAGLVATIVSAALADYFWMEPVGQFGIANSADLISMVVFLASGTLISYLAEAAYRAQARAHKAEEQSRLAAEREKAEVLLQRQAELLHLSYDAIIVWQFGGPIETWNKGAEELYGYSQKEAVGQVTHDLLKTIHSEPRIQIEAKLQERKFWEGELKHRTSDGREVIVSARLQLVRGADGVERVLETNRDITDRMQAEQEIYRQREWLRVTLTSIGDAVIATDASGLVTFINPVAETLTARQSEEAVGLPVQKVFRIINEQTREPAVDIVGQVLREGSIVALANHTALVAPDGREISIEDSAAPIKDSDGNISGAVLVFHDVTERRRAQKALRESEERLRLFIEHAPASLAMFDREMQYLSVSRRWQSDYNLGDRDLRGLSHYDVFPEISDEWKEVHRRGLAGEVVRADADRFDRPDGSVQWLRWEVRPWHDAAGDVAGIVIFSEDITQRKQAEEALRGSEERFRVMADSIPQLAWIAQADGYIYWYNQRWFEYTGTTAEQMQGWGWQSVHNSETLPGVLERWKNSIATGKPFDMVFPLRGADGSFREFLTRVMPVKNAHGDVIQWCGTNTDITEHKQMEDELRKARDELELRVEDRTAELKKYMAKLEQSNQALQDFASIASHDLQEPLRKVKAFGDMLKQKCGGSLDDHGQDYLERILNANQRMQSLLTGLLDYSRVTTKAEPLKEVDLSDLISQVLSDLEVRIVKTGGEVNVGNLPVISADPTQMRQLFQNLIGNSLKFHKPGEKPTVQVRSVPTTGSGCQIIVEDNGIGFDEQYLDKIFAPFQRLHGRSSQYEGTGMGLAICKKIVEWHGGSITATSAPGIEGQASLSGYR